MGKQRKMKQIRKLKRMYDKHGLVGMVAYAKAVDQHLKNTTP